MSALVDHLPVRNLGPREAAGHGGCLTPDAPAGGTRLSGGTLTVEEALAVAARGGVAAPLPGGALPPGLEAGAKVQVTGLDGAGEPVVGELLAGDPGEIVIGRDDPRAGHVCVHFPRVGHAVAPV